MTYGEICVQIQTRLTVLYTMAEPQGQNVHCLVCKAPDHPNLFAGLEFHIARIKGAVVLDLFHPIERGFVGPERIFRRLAGMFDAEIVCRALIGPFGGVVARL